MYVSDMLCKYAYQISKDLAFNVAFHRENSSCNFHCWGSSPVDVGTIAHLQLEWFHGIFSFYVLSVMFQGDDFTKVWSVEGKTWSRTFLSKYLKKCDLVQCALTFGPPFFTAKNSDRKMKNCHLKRGFWLKWKKNSLPAFFRIYSLVFRENHIYPFTLATKTSLQGASNSSLLLNPSAPRHLLEAVQAIFCSLQTSTNLLYLGGMVVLMTVMSL